MTTPLAADWLTPALHMSLYTMTNVWDTIGYAVALGESIEEIVRSGGILMPLAAAEVASSVGEMNCPDLFLTAAKVKPFCRA